jgi:hypothetical protein
MAFHAQAIPGTLMMPELLLMYPKTAGLMFHQLLPNGLGIHPE